MLHDIMDDDFKVSGDITDERYGQQLDALPVKTQYVYDQTKVKDIIVISEDLLQQR